MGNEIIAVSRGSIDVLWYKNTSISMANKKSTSSTIIKMNIENKIKSFHRRWNIEISEENRWNNFKDRMLNSYASILKHEFVYNESTDEEFFNLLGIHRRYNRQKALHIDIIGKDIEDCLSYIYFKNETDIKNILLGIEVISWMQTLNSKTKESFLLDIKNIINITNIPVELKYSGTDFIFYPAGAKLLDEKLVNDNLDWLTEYPNIYQLFASSLSDLGIQGKERHVIDNLRLSIELLLKEKLNNSKSLENQKSELGKYLKSKNISSEISNIYWVILDYYSKYQNNNVKHHDNVNSSEVEFILYITGCLMRMLLIK